VSRLGHCGATVRLPITPLSAAGQATVERAMVEAGLVARP
jgi:4-hydroxy-tetrahydrodipicolinate synthase